LRKPRIGCYAVYEPSEQGWQDLETQMAQILADLRAAGLEVLPAPQPVCDGPSCQDAARWFQDQDIDLLHALIVTWSFDHYSIEILQANPVPLAIRSIPGIRSGSIVGAQQLNSLLADLQLPHKLLFGAPGQEDTADSTARYARACALRKDLSRATIGVIGRRTEGMTPIAVDEVEILRLFGTRLWNLGLDELQERAALVDPDRAASAWDDFARKASSLECLPQDGIRSFQLFLALQALRAEKNLQALSIGSYPKCQGTLCLPIALLNESGLPTGCEGDVNATIAMFLLSRLSESPVHFGEMLDFDLAGNSLVSSHCGAAAPSLADDCGFDLCAVRLANEGVCIRFQAHPGPVTLVNLVGRHGNYRLCAIEGEALPTGMVFEGNPMRIFLHTPIEVIWEAVGQYGFGHHWMAAYGHFATELKDFCALSRIRGIFPGRHPFQVN
jgi:L-fucose isomerase-like protein